MRLRSLLGMALVLAACSSGKAPSSDAGTSPAAPPGTGGVTGSGGTRPVTMLGEPRDAEVACTEGGSPDDEFSVPCAEHEPVDAGIDAGAPLPPPDAGGPGPVELDAGLPFDAGHDASTPTSTGDEGQCAVRDDSCQFGHAATVLDSATCTIAGNSLYLERQVCEVCGKPTDIGDFSLTVMDCGGCAQVYSEGYATPDIEMAPNDCIQRSDPAGLAWTASDLRCVDVYAYVGSGIGDINGWTMQSGDLVRVCRCDRTTDTCKSCVGGACNETP